MKPFRTTCLAFLGAAVLLGLAGCEEVERIRDAGRDRTPHEAYLASLSEAGLAQTALVRDWIAAGLRAVENAPTVQLPFQEEGFIAVNLGNQHTLGVLLRRGRILGLFEHHTVLMDPEKLVSLVDRLREGTLTNEEVYQDHGHGAFIGPDHTPGAGFDFVAVTGPQRQMTADLGYHFAAPHGDMMLTGCYGLVKGYALTCPDST